MRHSTHSRVTRRIIDAVDFFIDSSPKWMPIVSEKLGKMPGLSYDGHRKRGHDLTSGLLSGLVIGAIEGFVASGSHLSLDAFRTQLLDKLGPAGANIAEELINLAYEIYLEKTGRARRKRRKKSQK